jgi:hypothetical protein
MGIYDRDWHKEERKQARRAAQAAPQPPPSPPQRRASVPRSPPVDLTRFFPEKTSPDISVFGRQVLLFIVLILAIYGAISLVQHFRNKPAKALPATPAVSPPPAKVPPEYYIKRAPSV